MQRRLTSRLSKVLLISALCVASTQLLAIEQNTLASEEPANYIAELKALYLTASEREALVAHSNALLDIYALRAGYQVGRADPLDIRYQLSVGESGELRIREETRGAADEVRVRNRSLSVFGLDPYLQYECPQEGVECVLHSPADGSAWLTIVRDPEGAQELAKALSFLLRNLQKG